jgi:hypothetical protein
MQAIRPVQREGRRRRPRAHELSQSRQSRPDLPAEVDFPAGPAEAIHVHQRERPRSHAAHLAAQNVDELWQFVETRRAQHASDTRHAAVPHRAEFEDGKRPAPVTQTRLGEEDWRAVVEQDGDRNDRHDRREDHQTRAGSCEIEQTLGP